MLSSVKQTVSASSQTEAKKIFEDVVKSDATNKVSYLCLGQCYQAEKKLEDAMKCYNKALEIDPKFGNALCSKANCLDEMKKKDEAIKVYEEANSLAKQNAIYLLDHGLCLYEMGLDNDAYKMVDRAELTYTMEHDLYDSEEKTFINTYLARMRAEKDKEQQ